MQDVGYVSVVVYVGSSSDWLRTNKGDLPRIHLIMLRYHFQHAFLV